MKQYYEKNILVAKWSIAIILPVFITFFLSCNKPDFQPAENETASGNSFNIAASGRPNFVIILGDDIGYDALTFHGNQTFETPRLDKMRKQGMDFTQCHSAPLCSPSRFMFVTGKYNFRNYTLWGEMNPNEKTFATLLRDAGYVTYVAGKWQFNGADTAIHSLGYDDYSVWDPSKDLPAGSHYRDPNVYEYGAFLPSSQTKGKYGDDIFTNRALTFIKQNKQKNFFVYFPITLCHDPFFPTPDDPEFQTWPAHQSDPKFFPSMIKYMDKKIGQVIDSLKAWRLYNNTIVMFVGDNGTPHDIFYYVNGVLTEGGKAETKEAGTHVPLIVTWPNKITPGQVNRNMVDFTDFLPTVADAAGVSIPVDYGIIDGVSFYNQLTGSLYVPRDWIFDHYQPNTNKGYDVLKRWIQDTTYKLYDSTGKFFNIDTDPKENFVIKSADMTLQEKQIKKKFQAIMDTLK